MRLVHFSTDGADRRVGIERSGTVHDVSESMGRFDDALAAAAEGTDFGNSGETYDTDGVRLLPPTTARNTTFAVALNYYSHIEEVDQTGTEFERPLIFTKSHRALVGHDEPIEYDTRVTTDLDYEGELAAVIGKPGRHIDESDALDHVAGYTVLNDITARDLQNVRAEDAEWLDWFSSKALQRSTPVGPAVVTADEVGDPSDLHIETRHNGDVVQDEGTHLMIYDVADLVSFVSTRVRLQPGDIVATGTPKGVGHFQDVSLADGDEVTVTIEGVGTLTNVVDRVQ
jgi:2-keto-4-pentenoate hydratase/2-oxohepta-3-ene-1,7-dioic acid hydratase in catechol pathway